MRTTASPTHTSNNGTGVTNVLGNHLFSLPAAPGRLNNGLGADILNLSSDAATRNNSYLLQKHGPVISRWVKRANAARKAKTSIIPLTREEFGRHAFLVWATVLSVGLVIAFGFYLHALRVSTCPPGGNHPGGTPSPSCLRDERREEVVRTIFLIVAGLWFVTSIVPTWILGGITI